MSVALAGVSAPAAWAEFTVGDKVPEFSLRTSEGKPIELRRGDATLRLQVGDVQHAATALVIHLLQPDCLQCRAQLEALKPVADRYRERGVLTLGIAHRGTSEDVREMNRSLDLNFPVAMGVDSDIARRFSAGDTLGITDATGVVRFAQVGYGEGDAKLWVKALDALLAGKEVTQPGVDRERLAVGDRMPTIHLPSLRSGKPMTLAGDDDGVVFRGDDGKESRPKAAVGFFSRY